MLSRSGFAIGVLAAHVVAITWISGPITAAVRQSEPGDLPITAFVVKSEPSVRKALIPEGAFEKPRPDLSAIQMAQFEAAEWGDISDVIATSSAPQLSRFQPVDPSTFARRAGLAQGQSASLVLTVEVLPDGRVGTVEITRSTGDPKVDAAAVAYARLLRFIPGTREHRAETMRVSISVTLTLV